MDSEELSSFLLAVSLAHCVEKLGTRVGNKAFRLVSSQEFVLGRVRGFHVQKNDLGVKAAGLMALGCVFHVLIR